VDSIPLAFVIIRFIQRGDMTDYNIRNQGADFRSPFVASLRWIEQSS
jgi:hypothetical protein